MLQINEEKRFDVQELLKMKIFDAFQVIAEKPTEKPV
jgi:hypothetical protein